MYSALIASANVLEREDRSDNRYVGRVLATVLTNMGPAGVKLAQAIHSFPDTPEDIRLGMGNVKGAVNMPKRIEVLDRMIKLMGRDGVASKFKRLGRVIGAGSYQYTYEAELVDYEQLLALTLLRSHARAYALNEF